MDYSDLKSIFGEPDGDIGSGIHIYVNNLDDGTIKFVHRCPVEGMQNIVLLRRDNAWN